MHSSTPIPPPLDAVGCPRHNLSRSPRRGLFGSVPVLFATERTGCSRSAPLWARQRVENLTRAALKTARNEFATVSVANPSFARGAAGWLLGLPPMWWQTPQSLLPASPLFGFPPSRGRGAASGRSSPPHDEGNAEKNPGRPGSFLRSPATSPARPEVSSTGRKTPKETGRPFEACFLEAHPPALRAG